MYRVDADPVNILDSVSLEQQLESMRHQIGMGWSRMVRRQSGLLPEVPEDAPYWRDETRFSENDGRPARTHWALPSFRASWRMPHLRPTG